MTYTPLRFSKMVDEINKAHAEKARLRAVLELIAAGAERPDELAKLALKHAA